MKIPVLALTLIGMAAAMAQSADQAPSPSLRKDSPCYELRTYYAMPGKLEDLHARFRDHTLAIFEKHGMKMVGFWGPTDKSQGSDNRLVYVLQFPSREAAKASWSAFRADPEWQQVSKASEANGKLVERVESIFMASTDYSPVH